MSRFVLDVIEYQPPAARDATVVGTQYDAYEAASATVDEENLAEEGLTQAAFATSAHIKSEALTSTTGTPTTIAHAFGGAYAQLALDAGATAMRVTPTAGALLTGEAFRLRAFLNVSVIDYAPLQFMDLRFRLVQRTGGVTSKITASEWVRYSDKSAGPVTALEQGRAAGVRIESWITTAATYDWFEVQYLFAGAAGSSATIANGVVILDRLYAVEVV